MSELLPTTRALDLQAGLVDFLTTTFALADADARVALEDFLRHDSEGIFKGPYVRLRLPFRPAEEGWQQHLEWTPEGFVPYVRDRYQRDRVVSGLTERGVAVRGVEREAALSTEPVVMTMHLAKGTEFYKVLLFGLSEALVPKGLESFNYSADEQADALLRERSLLYVAATRARDELVVSWSKARSRLLPSA